MPMEKGIKPNRQCPQRIGDGIFSKPRMKNQHTTTVRERLEKDIRLKAFLPEQVF